MTELPDPLLQSFWEEFRSIFKKDITKMTKKDIKVVVQRKMVNINRYKKDKATRIKYWNTLSQPKKRKEFSSVTSQIKELRQKEATIVTKSHIRKGKQVTGYTRTRHSWTKQQEAFIVNMKHRDTSYITSRLNQQFGTSITKSAVQTKKFRLLK